MATRKKSIKRLARLQQAGYPLPKGRRLVQRSVARQPGYKHDVAQEVAEMSGKRNKNVFKSVPEFKGEVARAEKRIRKRVKKRKKKS